MEHNFEKACVIEGVDNADVDSVNHMVQSVEDEETPIQPPKQDAQISCDSSTSEQPEHPTEESKKSVIELNKEGLILLFGKMRERLCQKIKYHRSEFLTERRKHFNKDRNAYKQATIEYLQGIPNVNDSAILEVLNQEGLTNHDLQNAIIKLSNDSEVRHAMNQPREADATPATVPDSLTIDKLQEIFEYQIEKLEERKGTASIRLDIIQTQAEIFDCIFEDNFYRFYLENFYFEEI